MAAASIPASRFQMGRVVSRTFGVLGRNFIAFAALAALLVALPAGLVDAWQHSLNAAGNADAARLVGSASNLLTLATTALLQAAVMYGTISDLNGHRASVGDCLSTGARFILPVIGLSIVSGLGIVLGILFFVIPGVYMAVCWSVIIPVVVVEARGFRAAFERSADLTRGHRWAVLGLMLVYLLALMTALFAFGALAGGVLGAIAGLQVVEGMLFQAIVSGIAQGVVALVGAVGVAALYYELRSVKEGIGPEALAGVFD